MEVQAKRRAAGDWPVADFANKKVRRLPLEAVVEPDIQDPKGAHEALRYMRMADFLKTEKWHDQQHRADREGAHLEIVEFEKAFIRRFKKLGVPMYAHCVMRDANTQQFLYDTGKSKATPGKSPHNHGFAVDLVHGHRHWDMPKVCWDLIGEIGYEVAARLGIEIEWGGEWNFYDPAHWQIAMWKHRKKEAHERYLTGSEIAKLWGLE